MRPFFIVGMIRREILEYLRPALRVGDAMHPGGLMRYTPREPDPIFDLLEPLVRGMGLSLLEVSLSGASNVKAPKKTKNDAGKRAVPREAPRMHIRIVVYKNGVVSIDDCSRVHRAAAPRLELSFPQHELYVEVSSPGISRLIKDGSEFMYYIGRGVRCYSPELSDWVCGILTSADSRGITLQTQEGVTWLEYARMSKAKLDYTQEV